MEGRYMIFEMTPKEEMEFIIYMLNKVNRQEMKSGAQVMALDRICLRLRILRSIVNKKSLFRVIYGSKATALQ